MLVCINAGHHPKYDPGAVNNVTGLREADVCKIVADKVIEYLRAASVDAIFVQENELEDIVYKANKFHCDLFVSIHCNSFVRPEASGTETFYSGSSESRKLADCVQKQLISTLGTYDRGLKTDNFYVLRYTDMPAILTELAFISNETEEKLLADPYWQDEIAKAIARGITDYNL